MHIIIQLYFTEKGELLLYYVVDSYTYFMVQRWIIAEVPTDPLSIHTWVPKVDNSRPLSPFPFILTFLPDYPVLK